MYKRQLAHYHGISITIDLPRAQQTLSSLEAIMGDLDIHLETIAERFCREAVSYTHLDVYKRQLVLHVSHVTLAEFFKPEPHPFARCV